MTDKEFFLSYRGLDNYQALIVRWLTGANFGKCGPLYISNRGKGSSLFIEGLELFQGKKKKQGDTRLAVLQNKNLRILTINDGLGIEAIATRLGYSVIKNSVENFRADGVIKNGVVQTKES
jgi:hypothetical protein